MISGPPADSQKVDQDPPDLELCNISKAFGSVAALTQASIAVRRGSVHALLGENGAGKTTLMRIAFGMMAPDSGSIRVDGIPRTFRSPSDAIADGIGMVHQQFSLIPEMTVAENVALGGRGRYDRNSMSRRIESITARMGIRLDPLARVAALTGSERQKLEIVRTLAHHATILILDEPTAVLTPEDIGDLFEQIEAFAANGGSVVLITHKLQDALMHADEVTVLRHGRCILNRTMLDVDQNMLASAMLGESGHTQNTSASTSRAVPQSKVVLELNDVSFSSVRDVERLTHVSLQLAAGEILGVAALDGAARSLLHTIAGRIQVKSGQIIRPPAIGFVPEDRQNEAIIPTLSLTENMALGGAGSLSGTIDWEEMGRVTELIIDEYAVRAASPQSLMRELSGGNQQKFVLGRELRDSPALLVLENPTQGLDIKATTAIHDRIRRARNEGAAVVVYSSDLDELATLCDRVAVVSRERMSMTSPDRRSIGALLLDVTR